MKSERSYVGHICESINCENDISALNVVLNIILITIAGWIIQVYKLSDDVFMYCFLCLITINVPINLWIIPKIAGKENQKLQAKCRKECLTNPKCYVCKYIPNIDEISNDRRG